MGADIANAKSEVIRAYLAKNCSHSLVQKDLKAHQ
jgi:hypothetical protein